MKKFKQLLLTTMTIFLIIGPISLVSASNLSETTKADHVAGLFEKLNEKFTMLTKFKNEDKVDYQITLTHKRYGELLYIKETEKYDRFEEVSSRYSSYLGRLIALLDDSKSSDDDLNHMIEIHKIGLENAQNEYEFDSAWWLMLQHNRNILNELEEKNAQPQ